jgi:hypothetical protein
MHLIFLIFVGFIIPESLSPLQMVASRDRHQQELKDLKEAREGVAVGLLVRIKKLFGFLSPLTMFIPTRVEGPRWKALHGHKRDWNLTLVAAGFGLMSVIMVSLFRAAWVVDENSSECVMQGSYTYKFQYASSTFQWSSEMVCPF